MLVVAHLRPYSFKLLDSPEVYNGAPVGLQIIARKWEEKVWAIAKIIDNGLKTMAAS